MAVSAKITRVLDCAGLQVFSPIVLLIAGEEPKVQLKKIAVFIGMPIVAFAIFLLAWSVTAKNIVTKYGTVPTPTEVWEQAGSLLSEHYKTRAAEREFFEEQKTKSTEYAAQAEDMKKKAAAAPDAETRAALEKKATRLAGMSEKALAKKYSSNPTYLDQIATSLKTVFAGFVLASLIAIPLGILCGLSKAFMAAMNPLIQIFKPVSPLAWLPIVMIVVGAMYTTDPSEAWFQKSFISSAITVALCSLWPTLVNTALGVASIDKDYLNVARVLKLGWWHKVRKIVIPSALPLIFTGLRLSLGVGWMVLIAAEMLAQNPGLGKFVWDMFQNGSSQTLAQIVVAVFTIGIIGFMLDRIMIVLQRSVSYEAIVA